MSMSMYKVMVNTLDLFAATFRFHTLPQLGLTCFASRIRRLASIFFIPISGWIRSYRSNTQVWTTGS